jgi:hypothetical protein
MKYYLTVLMMLFFAVSGAITIYEIQYTEAPNGDSPYLQQVVTIEEAVVTAVGWTPNSGHASFFIADPEGGLWSGVMAYDFDEAYVWSLNEGDLVTITATVVEYYGLTELNYIDNCEVIGTAPVPDPIPVSTADLAGMEALEGCLVRIDDVTVTQAQDGYGQWYVTDGSGPCQIDDSFFYLDNVDPPIEINVDDFWGRIVGMVNYSYSEYELNPRYPEDMYPDSNYDNALLKMSEVSLCGNYPNPFNPVTTIEYALENPASIDLAIYDISGRRVKTLFCGSQVIGEHLAVWDGVDNNGKAVASGIYFSRLSHSNGVETTKMLLLK